MIEVKVLKDSVNPSGQRLTTYVITYPRMIHAEIMTHRVLSKNSASSRAIPAKKMRENIRTEPATPEWWGKNQSGMQAETQLESFDRSNAQGLWARGLEFAVELHKSLETAGLHKQIANRVLEPWMHITVLISGTAWDNFFALRAHPAAQPEFQVLAYRMLDCYLKSVPQKLDWGQWHVPFEDRMPEGVDLKTKLKIATARAARLSYLTFEGEINVEKDIQLHDSLVSNGHMCYDGQTEVLTTNGWKFWPEVCGDDLLAAVDITTRKVVFERPSVLHRSNYNGLVYQVNSRQLDLVVTPNHKMVTSRRRKGNIWTPFVLEDAITASGECRRYLKSANLEVRKEFVNPWGLPPEKFARLVGFFIGDGSIGSLNLLRFNIRLKRKVKFLQSLGLPLRPCGKGWYVVLPGSGKWFAENCYKDKHKSLPFGLDLTESEFSALCDGLKNSDGSIKRKTWIYDTASVQLTDQLQALFHVNGLVLSCNKRCKPNAKYLNCYRLNVGLRTDPEVNFSQKGRCKGASENWVKFEGDVFCATVSTGALMVRRNGKVAVSGNSPTEHCAFAEPVVLNYGPADSEADCAIKSMLEMLDCVDLPERYKRVVTTHRPDQGNFYGFTQYRKLLPNENRTNVDLKALLAAKPDWVTLC